MNPDVLFQAMCRVVRQYGDAKKLYLKVAPVYLAPAVHHTMSFTVAASAFLEFFTTYGGPPWKTVPVPHRPHPRPKEAKAETKGSGKGKRARVEIPLLPQLLTFHDLAHLDRTDASAIAWTSFQGVRELYYGPWRPDWTEAGAAGGCFEVFNSEASGERSLGTLRLMVAAKSFLTAAVRTWRSCCVRTDAR